MPFACMCASEDCQINGCARFRSVLGRSVPVIPTSPPLPTASKGWVCPKCGGVNGPNAMICFHCKPSLDVPMAAKKEG